ncbi:MAG: UvrD-helicase domain-containing protein [Actinobacteria bacterium]|nr:UvrD-helicase domain-containing protein [Actinomycetota bacterium]
MEINLTDQHSRDRIIFELETNFFVEAGAGSGKTYCLVERMVNLIKQGRAKIENIAAVTFTRKAAAELKERFQIKLEEAASAIAGKGAASGQKENLKEAISNLEQVFVGTIHSFCSKILRERPVEAGIDCEFEEIEEEEDALYADMAWAGFIEQSHAEGNGEIFELVSAYDISPDDLKEIYKSFIRYPDVCIVTEHIAEPDFKPAKEKIADFLDYMRKVMPVEVPAGGWDELQKVLRSALYFLDSGYFSDDRLFAGVLKTLCRNSKVTLNRWPDGNGKSYQEKYNSLQDEVILPAVKELQKYLHKPLADFAQKGAAYYQKWRRQHSILNFEDLLTMTAKLLKRNSEVRKYFKKRFSHILVDEFQDTDPIQAEIMLLLVSPDEGEADWKKLKPAQGSLFLVGDPKQSIYRFRRADIDIYNAVKGIYRASQGCAVVNLDSNFRSLPFMEDIVGEVFKTVFPAEDNRYQAKYAPLKTVRTSEKGGRFFSGLFENNIPKVNNNNPAAAAEMDAKIIAGWIDDAVQSDSILLERAEDEKKADLPPNARYSDFLILSRKKENLRIYARELEKRGIPYDISGGKIFNQSEELYEILKLFKAIEDELDPVALVTALRGLFFGISDDFLYRFSIAGGKFNYYSKTPPGFNMFEDAYERLRHYRQLIIENEPVVAAGLIVEELGIIPLSISEEEGLTRGGNIYKALELLRSPKRDEMNTFYELVKNLEELLKVKEVQSFSLMASRQNVVRLMNLHKAKGLEASIVMLADPLGQAGEFEPQAHINRTSGNSSKGYFTVIRQKGNYGRETIGIPPQWDIKAAEEKEYERAERDRLEYVAVTRAKNALIVSTYREGSKAKAWEILYDILSKSKKLEVIPAGGQKEMEILEINAAQWEQTIKAIKENCAIISSPGYSLTNVTSEAKEGYVFAYLAAGASSGGAEWGKIAHMTIEELCRQMFFKKINVFSHGPSLPQPDKEAENPVKPNHRIESLKDSMRIIAGKWIEDAGLEKRFTVALDTLVNEFLKSDLLQRLENAPLKYFEVPFAYNRDGQIMHGIIDLVFKENGGWVIVDYKTDDFEKDPARKLAYIKQLQIYKEYWEKITGEKVSETVLHRL